MATIQTIEMQVNSKGLRTSATALPAHDRKFGFIQNQGTNKLYVKHGDSCSTTDYDYILDPCSTAEDGNGGISTFDEDGIVTVAGTSPSYTAFER